MPNEEELKYLQLCQKCIDSSLRPNRTGTPAYTTFGEIARYDLSTGRIPLLTTKQVNWQLIVKELLWFISGNTDSNALDAMGCKIWNDNGSREYLDSVGFKDREQGDLGPVYGFQWRHWGAEYHTHKDHYEGEGIDQLGKLIETIRAAPNANNRRLILSAWNVGDLSKMALPPCHMTCQFDVHDGQLSCLLYQRSADMGLGVPFNIASYSILTRMVAQLCGLKAKEFVHVMGNVHVYEDHVEPLRVQMARTPKEFPLLKLDETVTGSIDDFRLEHFQVEGYNPHAAIKMKMSK